MIRIVQHLRLARPISPRLARRLVYGDSRLSPLNDFGMSTMILGRVTSDAEDVPKTMSVGVGKGAGASSSQQATVLISAPKKEELDPEEELIEDSEARFQISERAAERLRAIALKENNPNVALRVSVESGGCHGYQYKIDLSNLSDGAGDYHFARPTIAPSNVLIDPTSLSLLTGATLDFATELIGSTFRVTDNPHAVGGCGCGVSWEAKI